MILLDIRNLTLEIESNGVLVKALDKVSLSICEKEIRALVGESGSGKSLIVRAISGSLPPQWIITADRLTWRGQNLLKMSKQTFALFRFRGPVEMQCNQVVQFFGRRSTSEPSFQKLSKPSWLDAKQLRHRKLSRKLVVVKIHRHSSLFPTPMPVA